MALGIHLSGMSCRLHAMGVCDDPQYFSDYIDGLLKGMGVDDTVGDVLMTPVSARFHSHPAVCEVEAVCGGCLSMPFCVCVAK